ncbi:hypothetical protein RM550_28550 [Streptomyces sp. DSM 41527]|uniref:Uncharacterized protein n=1 Tax=Streptomyces mooreae TaxID=3075523 RepID=A0ABU2TFA5_9ACTN|nr:hypothetical protein [Streptomyces sp. DSM 41527]MDT0459620.1 hypothetical protein [Streptomyces sp. DSM 41527]
MMRRHIRAAVAVVAAAFLTPLLTASPAPAVSDASARPADGAGRPADCRPALQVLASLPGSGDSQVKGLGPKALAVGASRGLPVYWTGTRVHRVPLPAGFTGGEVAAVNAQGLMVGSLNGPGRTAAFSFRSGARTVTLLPEGAHAADVNDRGLIVGDAVKDGDGALIGLEWEGARIHRRLTPPAGYALRSVTAINDAGQIVGSGEAFKDEESWSAGLFWSARRDAAAVPLQRYWPSGVPYDYWYPRDIDRAGRIVGTHDFTRLDTRTPTQWLPPYATESEPGLLGERTSGTFEAISPTTHVSVGTAMDSHMVGPFPPETAPPEQAQIWPGSGPLLALPRLSPEGASQAYAVSDDQRVGGSAADAASTSRAVVWTCALRQAYQP